MTELLPKRFYDVSRLSQINLRHMLRLTNEILTSIENYIGLRISDTQNRTKVRRSILATICELYDTWLGLCGHVTPARWQKHVSNWDDIKCDKDQTQHIMDCVRRCKGEFELGLGIESTNQLKACLCLMKTHLESTLHVPQDRETAE